MKIYGNKTFKIRGARAYSYYVCNMGTPTTLTALDPETLLPVMAVWTYEGDAEGEMTEWFVDRYGDRYLTVSAEGYQSVTLNSNNMVATVEEAYGRGMFLIRKDDGTASCWGTITQPLIEENHDINQICASMGTCIVRRNDNSVYSWGEPGTGGELPSEIAQRKDIQSIGSNNWGGIAQGSEYPHIAVWGNDQEAFADLFHIPEEILSMDNIRSLYSNVTTFAVLNEGNQVFAWGELVDGGLVPEKISALTDIKELAGTGSCWCALRYTGEVVTWGQSTPEIPDDIRNLTDIKYVVAGPSSFAALRDNGTVVAWPARSDTSPLEYEIPDEIAQLTNIVSLVVLFNFGFVVLTSDGAVYTWGNYQGMVESVSRIPIAARKDVVFITTNGVAIAALKNDGSVVAWGGDIMFTQPQGEDTSPVDDLLTDVVSIIPNYFSFMALKSDNTIVVWGYQGSGGTMNTIPDGVQGNISYLKPL